MVLINMFVSHFENYISGSDSLTIFDTCMTCSVQRILQIYSLCECEIFKKDHRKKKRNMLNLYKGA